MFGSGLRCRLFLSAEAPPALERALPPALLQNSLKLTNEPPDGLKVCKPTCVVVGGERHSLKMLSEMSRVAT
jgi:hypothetical protein